MAVDIYFKLEEYPFYDQTEIEVNDNVEIFLQQVEMILTTPKTSVLGDPDFGCALETYLWDTQVSSSAIKQEVLDQIATYIDYEIRSYIDYDINVAFIKGEVWDTAVIDIVIDGISVAGYAVTP